jgi:glycosyltransferase involved in cell wall biosynthesis
VRFTGYLEDIRPEIRRSAVCVIPLRRGTGTRLKILEAMALGTPVVSTSKGAEGLDVRHGEHLLIADQPADFARCVQALLQDSGLAERLAIKARALVDEKYSWSTIGARFVALVENTVTRSRQGSHGCHGQS